MEISYEEKGAVLGIIDRERRRRIDRETDPLKSKVDAARKLRDSIKDENKSAMAIGLAAAITSVAGVASVSVPGLRHLLHYDPDTLCARREGIMIEIPEESGRLHAAMLGWCDDMQAIEEAIDRGAENLTDAVAFGVSLLDIESQIDQFRKASCASAVLDNRHPERTEEDAGAV